MALCNRQEPEKEARREKKRERWTVRARLVAWLMDWLAGLQSWLAAAERTETHRGTEQTQTCHFRRLIQSVMIFPHLAALCSLSSWPSMLLWTLAAQLFFLPMCTTYRFMQHWNGEENQGLFHNNNNNKKKIFICYGQFRNHNAIINWLKGLNHAKEELVYTALKLKKYIEQN